MVITFAPEHLERIEELAAKANVWVNCIGKTADESLTISVNSENVVKARVRELQQAFMNTLDEELENQVVLA